MARKKKLDDAQVADSQASFSSEPGPGDGGSLNGLPSPIDGLAGPDMNAATMEHRETIVVRVDSAGRIDLDSMREKTVGKLKAAIQQTPNLFPAATLTADAVPGFFVTAVYQLVGGLEQWIFARKYGPEIALLMAYGPQDIAILSDPTKAVLAKYMPALGRYQEETALAMALASIHMAKIAAMNRALASTHNGVTEIKPATEATQ